MPRQLFSLSNIKFKNYYGLKKVEEFEKFDGKITSAYKVRDDGEKKIALQIANIFPGCYQNNVSYHR